jgi:hypothetical protein
MRKMDVRGREFNIGCLLPKSAGQTATAFAARAIARVRLRAVSPVRTAIDPDNRKDYNGRGLGNAVDIAAAAAIAAFFWKLDDFTHCSPLFRSGKNEPYWLLHAPFYKSVPHSSGVMHTVRRIGSHD